MTLHAQAEHLASKGRGPDSVLIHMTPKEVAGLDALARQHYGHGLTVNPDTGLPEAGILSSLLPMLAGIALTATGVGAPLAAMMVGGGTTLATGSLQKGLMAGLGAFGGAGMGGALADMGTNAATAAASSAAQAAPGAAAAAMPSAGAAASSFGDLGASGAAEMASTGMPTPGFEAMSAPNPASEMGFRNAMDVASDTMTQSGVPSMSQFDKMGAGMKDMTQPGGLDRFVKANGGGMKLAGNAMMAMQGAGAMTPTQRKFGDHGDDNSYIRPYDFDPRTKMFTAGNPYPAKEAPKRFAEGGISDVLHAAITDGGGSGASGGPTKFPEQYQYNFDPKTHAFTHVHPQDVAAAPADAGGAGAGAGAGAPGAAMQWYGADGQMTPEALKYIQTDQYRDESGMKYAGGGIAGLLKGPGDGTSDSIPARMPGGGPAALGDGEFVIPARHVSEIGNGSTQAGAKKLYAMMDRIEKARKRTPVAGNTRAERFMPA